MEASDDQNHHLIEDVAGIAGAQALAAVIAVAAIVLIGAHYVGVANEHGAPLEIPYASIGVFLIGALGVGMTLALPGRYRFVWTEPKARRAIIIGLGQMCATGLAIALAGYVLAGAWIDVTKPGQFIVAWVFYGLVAAGLGQSFVAVSAFALLLMKRGLPDLGD